jgi:hypothetical protein
MALIAGQWSLSGRNVFPFLWVIEGRRTESTGGMATAAIGAHASVRARRIVA